MPWAPEMPRPRGAIPEVPHGPQRQGPEGFCNMNQSSGKLCFPAHDRAYLEDIPKDRLGGIGFAEMSHVTCFEGFHLWLMSPSHSAMYPAVLCCTGQQIM